MVNSADILNAKVLIVDDQEAIFLSTFVLISQNLLSKEAEIITEFPTRSGV